MTDQSGVALVARIRAEMAAEGLEPDGRETELLSIAAELQDRIVALERSIAEEGMTSTSPSGIIRLHPAVGEVRQSRLALARVLRGVQVERDGKDKVKQKAARARWDKQNGA